jgi:flagella basal body P-ring formation protein FlgA
MRIGFQAVSPLAQRARRGILYLCLLILWILCLVVAEGEADVVVSEGEIQDVVADYVQGMMSDFPGEIEVTVRRQGDLVVPGTGSVELMVEPAEGRARLRSVPAVLEIHRGPVCVERHLLSADVRYFDQVAVAEREIGRGETLQAGALRLERREVTTRLGRYVRSLEETERMRTRTRIRAGRLVDERLLEPVPAVERRDQVRIEARVGAVVALALGVATESGTVGDRIVVRNIDSREKLLAEIVAPGLVRTIF